MDVTVQQICIGITTQSVVYQNRSVLVTETVCHMPMGPSELESVKNGNEYLLFCSFFSFTISNSQPFGMFKILIYDSTDTLQYNGSTQIYHFLDLNFEWTSFLTHLQIFSLIPTHLSTCMGGTFKCVPKPCEASCEVFGDPHISTFDGLAYDMYGKCNYLLVDHCHHGDGPKDFEVIMKNGACKNAALYTSCVRKLMVNLIQVWWHVFWSFKITFDCFFDNVTMKIWDILKRQGGNDNSK